MWIHRRDDSDARHKHGGQAGAWEQEKKNRENNH